MQSLRHKRSLLGFRPPILFALIASACASEPRRTATSEVSRATTQAPVLAVDGEVVARLLADVAWLADDEREGRRAGTAGEEAAARYIAARFAELGCEPAGDDGYFQAFEVPLPPRDGGGSFVRVRTDAGRTGGAQELRGPSALRPLFCATTGEVTAPVTFCGYGIADASVGRDDFVDVPGDGGIALIVRGVPPYAPKDMVGGARVERVPDAHAETDEIPETWGGAGSIFLKVMNAKRRGFDAVVIAQHPSDPDAIPPFDPTQAAVSGIPALAVTVDTAEKLFPGYAEFVDVTDTAAHAERPVELDVATVAADVRRETATARNVLARIPGRDATRHVVVGAHFDHLGHGGPGSLAPGETGAIHNGADDNASGTAVVMELARRWSETPPQAGVVFALWSGEELGLLGSEHWASHPTVPLDSVVCNLNLDMVGRAGDGKLAVLGAGSAAPFADWLADAGPAAGLELDVSLSGQGLGGSDHQVFLRRQIPAMHLFSGVHPDYHKPSDDVEGFEADGAARVAALTQDLAERLMSGDRVAYVEPPVEAANPGQRERGFSVWFGTVPEYGADVKGLLLAGTSAGSPAEKAGFLAGDVIVQVGDVEIETIHDFVYMLQVYKPGDVVLTRYVRDGEEREVRMTLATRAAE